MSLSDYQLSFQISPIILVGGIAGTGKLPLISILSSQNYSQGLLSPPNSDPTFGQFRILPGHTLMDIEVATFPVANQTVAANATITNPLRLSLEMLVPAGGAITLSSKSAIITGLKSTLDNHTAMGGWYDVATPSYIYQGCLLTQLVDTTDEEEGAQVQVRWRWDFMQPLLTASAAQAAQNQQMSRVTNQTQNAGDPPGSQTVTTGIGQPSANIVQNVVSAAAGPSGSNVTPAGLVFVNPNGSSGLGNFQAASPIAPGGI